MTIKSDTFYFAVCDGCGATWDFEEEAYLYESAERLEQVLRDGYEWTARDGKHYCDNCYTPEEPPPPSLPMFDALPGSDPRCESCGRILDCCNNCPKGCNQ